MIEFYNVKKKTKVKIAEEDVEKVKIEKASKNGNMRVRYAFKAVDDDGTKLTRFCSEADFNNLK
jgi:predicted DNA binding CopG/RHH family protein|tara:strand:+ start:687 stop:878 length:192 start_codon:yes stop_codon:yes gene_type:complete